MADKVKPGALRVHNVRMHSQGKSASGTLNITKHHLTFTFVPEDASAGKPVTQETASTAPTPAPDGGSSSSHTSNAIQDRSHDHAAPMKMSNAKIGKPKTVWVPWPMINRCVLRSSHLQAYTAPLPSHDRQTGDFEEDETSFPPVFGTGDYERPSSDSARLAPHSSPRRPASPSPSGDGSSTPHSGPVRTPVIRIRCRDFQMMAFHFHSSSHEWRSSDETARDVFLNIRDRCCVNRVEDMLAFSFHPPHEEIAAAASPYDAKREFARMGIGPKAPAEGPGVAWRLSEINKDYAFSATYPSVLCVPRAVSDNMLKYGGPFRSKSRIPALAYLHFNGGSITRSSQPMVGVQGKRNPQDERLVSAIFSSHTPPLMSPQDSPSTAPSLTSPSATTIDSSSTDPAAPEDSDVPDLLLNRGDSVLDEKAVEKEAPVRPRVYGSTRRNLIVDARPKLNVIANRAGGGGIEDAANYSGSSEIPVEKVFLGIDNIHTMRSSLERVVESLSNSDYIGLPPDQDSLRKSGWLGHITRLIDGSELVARAVGLAGSHVLIHCSDGWDRTSQVSALAQLMLDPHYRTIDGFITLVQKDFLSFGHKFCDRSGILGCEKWFEIENERIAPSRARGDATPENTHFQAFGSKALTGAKNWFDKNRGSLFRNQPDAASAIIPPSPPPHLGVHSAPAANDFEEKRRNRTDEKEISPVFHQFLETVYQLLRQYPHAFEFNERFLLRLLYQSYAGQYGEFLFNNEKERSQYMDKLPSAWPFFLARRREFVNPDYAPKGEEALLLPKRGSNQQVDVKWWVKAFGRKEHEMNVPRALHVLDPALSSVQGSSASLAGDPVAGREEKAETSRPNDATPREAKSTPPFSKMRDGLTTSLSGLSLRSPTARLPADPSQQQTEPSVPQGVESEALARSVQSPSMQPDCVNGKAGSDEPSGEMMENKEGDPLGVSGGSNTPAEPRSDRLDFAAFAAQNAFQDR